MTESDPAEQIARSIHGATGVWAPRPLAAHLGWLAGAPPVYVGADFEGNTARGRLDVLLVSPERLVRAVVDIAELRKWPAADEKTSVAINVWPVRAVTSVVAELDGAALTLDPTFPTRGVTYSIELGAVELTIPVGDHGRDDPDAVLRAVALLMSAMSRP